MRPSRHLAGPALILACMIHACAGQAAPGKGKAPPETIRWDEQQPGCTFSRSGDGRFQYALWSGDVGLTLSVDQQELEKVHRRHKPFFGVLLDVRYRGKDTFDVDTGQISLEFVSHFKVIQNAVNLNDFSHKVQNDADDFDRQTAREIAKHPEQKEAKEAYARTFQKEAAELQEFLVRNRRRTSQLTPADPEVSWWVLFDLDNKWLGKWKNQEEFILRVPLAEKIFEFGFKLPPKPGEVLLRRRDGEPRLQ